MSHFLDALHPDDVPPHCQGEPIEDAPEVRWPRRRDNGKPNTWHEFQEDPETTCCIVCGWAEVVHG